MPYTPPAGNAVNFNFGGPYSSPPATAVVFNFGTSPASPQSFRGNGVQVYSKIRLHGGTVAFKKPFWIKKKVLYRPRRGTAAIGAATAPAIPSPLRISHAEVRIIFERPRKKVLRRTVRATPLLAAPSTLLPGPRSISAIERLVVFGHKRKRNPTHRRMQPNGIIYTARTMLFIVT